MEASRNGLSSQRTALWRSFRNGDFEEEDVWNVLNEKSKISSDDADSKLFAESVSANHFPSASRMIPRPSGGGNAQIAPKSAPQSNPRWFKSNGSKNPRKFGSENDDSSDDEDEDESRVPPHELIAKRLAGAQISSFSVFEGVGRTLKGRDLSKVRNAVLTKTGFLESLSHSFTDL